MFVTQEGLLFGKVTQRVKDTISDSQINNYRVETKTCKQMLRLLSIVNIVETSAIHRLVDIVWPSNEDVLIVFCACSICL